MIFPQTSILFPYSHTGLIRLVSQMAPIAATVFGRTATKSTHSPNCGRIESVPPSVEYHSLSVGDCTSPAYPCVTSGTSHPG